MIVLIVILSNMYIYLSNVKFFGIKERGKKKIIRRNGRVIISIVAVKSCFAPIFHNQIRHHVFFLSPSPSPEKEMNGQVWQSNLNYIAKPRWWSTSSRSGLVPVTNCNCICRDTDPAHLHVSSRPLFDN